MVFGMVWYGIWYGMVWYGIWYGMYNLFHTFSGHMSGQVPWTALAEEMSDCFFMPAGVVVRCDCSLQQKSLTNNLNYLIHTALEFKHSLSPTELGIRFQWDSTGSKEKLCLVKCLWLLIIKLGECRVWSNLSRLSRQTDQAESQMPALAMFSTRQNQRNAHLAVLYDPYVWQTLHVLDFQNANLVLSSFQLPPKLETVLLMCGPVVTSCEL